MPGAEERCATHLQAAASARCESERQRNAAVRVPAGQRKQARREARDRAAKPFEIIKAMRHEVSQKPAATVAARLPALEAKTRGSMFEVPSHDHIPQAPDRASVQERFGALPRRQLRKIEIDDSRPSAFARRFENQARACEIGGEGLLEEDWLT